ncbi:MAG: hypothetical protein ACKO9B_16400 [Planctomycetota bacterium]
MDVLDSLAAELERSDGSGASAVGLVGRVTALLPPEVGAVLMTAASGGDGQAALAALYEQAAGATHAGWRFRVDLVYPLLVCALAAAGVASLAWWYGPLVAAVDDTLTGPQAGAVFDARPVVDVIRWPVIGVGLLGAAAVAAIAMTSRRQRAATRTSRLADVIASFTDPAARRQAKQAVTEHERLVRVHRQRAWGKVPGIVGSVVAGAAVLVYGLALFQPLVTLLLRVAEQPAVAEWRGAEPERGR